MKKKNEKYRSGNGQERKTGLFRKAPALASFLFASLLLFSSAFMGCGEAGSSSADASGNASTAGSTAAVSNAVSRAKSGQDASSASEASSQDSAAQADSTSDGMTDRTADNIFGRSFSLDDIPEYSGSPYVEVNGNVPYFTQDELTPQSYEQYGALDSLGRCTGAAACIGTDIMPTEKRGSIGEVKPTGWHLVKYEGIDGNYLYNRCHLIAYELSGENANERNLITGTRYLNVTGMLPFENKTAEYVKSTGNHVLYRVTPIFERDNLLASGVLMEAESVEDQGGGIEFCVYCYNVQPGITIDYATGDSSVEPYTGSDSSSPNTSSSSSGQDQGSSQGQGVSQGSSSSQGSPSGGQAITSSNTTAEDADYVLNNNTMKFHRPDCSSVSRMSDKNKVYYKGSKDDLVHDGYEPCKNCNQ